MNQVKMFLSVPLSKIQLKMVVTRVIIEFLNFLCFRDADRNYS